MEVIKFSVHDGSQDSSCSFLVFCCKGNKSFLSHHPNIHLSKKLSKKTDDTRYIHLHLSNIQNMFLLFISSEIYAFEESVIQGKKLNRSKNATYQKNATSQFVISISLFVIVSVLVYVFLYFMCPIINCEGC